MRPLAAMPTTTSSARDARVARSRRASLAVVLRVLDGHLERARAAREHSDHLPGRHVERRAPPRPRRACRDGRPSRRRRRSGALRARAARRRHRRPARSRPRPRRRPPGTRCTSAHMSETSCSTGSRSSSAELGADPLGAEPPEIGDVARLAHASASAISRCTTRRSSSASSRRRTGCTPPISSTTAMPSVGRDQQRCSREAGVPVGRRRPAPHSLASRRQPSARVSGGAPACRRVISASDVGRRARDGDRARASALAKRPRSSAGANRPACPEIPPSAQVLPSWTSPQTRPGSDAGRHRARSPRSAGDRARSGRYRVCCIPSGSATVSWKRRSSGTPEHCSSAQPSSM